jgi:hypothetical protein
MNMRHNIVSFLLLIPFLTLACEEKEKVSPCKVLIDQMVGTYQVKVTTYPRDPSQEGEQKDVLVFFEPNECNCAGDKNRILFNNLFGFFECTALDFNTNNTFQVAYQDGETWYNAPIQGKGFIKNGVFHFEGTVYTSMGELPIILDGKRNSSERRTDAC